MQHKRHTVFIIPFINLIHGAESFKSW